MIYIASDHAGFELKKMLIEHLSSKGLEVEDMGAHVLDSSDDYPDFIYPCALRVAKDNSQSKPSLGIVIGGSGQGEAIVANKVKGVRAAVFYGGNSAIVILAKEHNDSNVLSLGARYISESEAKAVVDLWLDSKFSGGERHLRRVAKIKKLEENLK